jgi:hypothetical protein
VKKSGKMTLETLRQRRVAFYHGISRDTLREAARRAREPCRGEPGAPTHAQGTSVDPAKFRVDDT